MATKREIQRARYMASLAGRGEGWLTPSEQLQIEEEERRRQEEELTRQQPFRNVTGSADTVPLERSLLEQLTPLYTEPREAAANIGEAFRGGGRRSAGAQLFTAEDQNDPLRSEVIRSLIETLDFQGGGAAGDLLDRITGTRQSNEEVAREMFSQGSQQIQAARQDSGNTLTRGLVDVASSPSSFASVVGGPAAFIGGADVYAQEYTAARLEGLDEANANKRAIGQAAVETALSTLPTGKLFGAFGGDAAKRLISDRARWAARTGTTSVAEAVQEATTTLTQLGLDSLTANNAEDESLRDYARQQLPKDVTQLWEMTKDSAVAGALGGGIIGGGMNTITMAAERGKLAGEVLNTVGRQQEVDQTVRGLREFADSPVVESPVADITPDREAQEDAAWEQRRLERAREDNRNDLRTSIQRRVDMAQDQVFELEEAINEGDTSQATLRQATEARRRLEQAQATLVSFEQRSAPPTTVIGPVVPQEAAPASRSPLVDEAGSPVKLYHGTNSVFDTFDSGKIGSSKDFGWLGKGFYFTDKKVTGEFYSQASGAESPIVREVNVDVQNPYRVGKNATGVKNGQLKGFPEDITNAVMQRAGGGATDDAISSALTQELIARGHDGIVAETTGLSLDEPALEVVAFDPKQVKFVDGLKASPPKKVRKTVAEKKVAVVDNQKFLNDAIQELEPNQGLRSATDRPATTSTSMDVAKTIVNKLGSGDANVAGRLLAQGNVRLVDTVEDIPADAVPVGSAGYYDGRQTYVVANQVNPENVIGDFLTVAAHEIKHGGDLATDATLRTRMGEVIGEKANTRINAQIRTLAEQGNETAVAALEAATAGSQDAAALELELPAYFMQFARDKRGTGAQRVLGDIVSSVRTNVKRVMPGDYEVNVNDVAYLSDQLLKETVLENPSLSSDTPNFLQMIVGKNATSFNEQERKGLVYKSRDGNMKTWMSDADSRIVLHEDDVWALENNNDIQDMPLTDILEHKQLFEEYPQLKNLKVSVRNMSGDALGGYSQAGKRISLNSKMFKGLKSGSRYFNNQVHRILLHEIQHAVQDIEGFDSGTSPERILAVDPDYFANLGFVNTATAELANFGLKIAKNDKLAIAKQLGLRDVTALPIFEKALSMTQKDIARGAALDTEEMLATGVVFAMELAKNEATRTPEVSRLIDTFNEINVAKAENDKLYSEATKKYRAKLGETEASYTENNIDVTEDGMDIRSDVASINPELAYGDTWLSTRRGLASIPFPRAAKVGDDPKAMNDLERAFRRLLVPGGGFGATLGEVMQHGKSLPSSLSARSTMLGNALLDSFKENAKRLDKPEDQIREEIGKRMDSIDKIEDRDVRRVALRALDREFPGIGTAVNELRNFKITLTQEIIRQRFRDPKPLTQKEVAIYTKMKNNAERYTTRAYLATYNTELGKRYGSHLLQQFKVEPDSEEGKTVQGAIDYLLQNDLIIPERAGLEAMKIGKLRRTYEMWFGSSARFKNTKKGREAMIAKLTDLPPRTKKELDNKAMEVVRDLLGLTDQGNRVRRLVTPSMRQNRTILEARSDLPLPLRKLMGEITDPFLRETISLQRMINLTTKTKVLTEIFEKGKDAGWWSDIRTDAHARELNGVAYGPLDGKWINQNVEDAITGTILSLDNIDNSLADLATSPDALMKAVIGYTIPLSHDIMAIQKTWQVVASPFNMVANFIGAVALMAPMQGIVDPRKHATAMRDTANVLVQEITTRYTSNEMSAKVQELLFAGVTDSATMGEFRSESFQTIAKQIQKMIDKGEYSPANLLKTVMKETLAQGELANGLRQAYAFMDVWTKVATYYDRKEYLTEYNKLENKGWTEENIIRQAGYEASGTNVSYERAIPVAKIAERNIPYFMFLTYFSETFRTVGMSYVQSYKDFQMGAQATEPKAKALAYKMGLKRFVGTTAAVAGVQAAVMAALGSEDEEEERKRKLDAPYMADKVILPMGLNKDGKEVMVELQRIDPIGPFNEFFTAIYQAEDKPQAAAKAVGDMFVESKAFLSLVKLGVDLTSSALANATGDESFREWDKRRKDNTILERNYPKIYEAIRSGPFGLLETGDVGENAVEVFETMFLPSTAKPFLDAEQTEVSEVREDDVKLRGEPIHEPLRVLGYRAYVRDPDKSLKFRKMDYDDAMGVLRNERNELNARANTMDAGTMLDAMLDIREREYEAFVQLAESMDGYLAFEGTTASDAIKLIDNKKLARRLRTQDFQSSLLDGEALKRWYDSEKKKPDVDKEELREKYKLLRDVYKETN